MREPVILKRPANAPSAVFCWPVFTVEIVIKNPEPACNPAGTSKGSKERVAPTLIPIPLLVRVTVVTTQPDTTSVPTAGTKKYWLFGYRFIPAYVPSVYPVPPLLSVKVATSDDVC